MGGNVCIQGSEVRKVNRPEPFRGHTLAVRAKSNVEGQLRSRVLLCPWYLESLPLKLKLNEVFILVNFSLLITSTYTFRDKPKL